MLFQLRSTLRAAESALTGTLPRIEEALLDIRRLSADASQLVEGLQSTRRLAGSIGAAIGPAIVAGLHSYRSAHDSAEKEAGHEQRTEHNGTE